MALAEVHTDEHRSEAGLGPEPLAEVQAPVIARRSVLKGIGLAGVTVLVAGAGTLSYRAYDNVILDAGSGTAYDAWNHWRDDPSPLGAVAAAILAANPHNTQPWTFRVTETSGCSRATRADSLCSNDFAHSS